MTSRGQPNKAVLGLDSYTSSNCQNIHLVDQNMDADDSFTFGFNSQSLPYSSSCPSSSGSFSSASSLYDALTPPPRNSTPQHPMDFDIAFGNDSLMFDDFTPSPPSTSGCFPLDMKPTVAPNMLCHGLPMTPSRSNSSAAAFQNNVDFTPTQSMDAYNFMDPLMIPTPSPLFSNHIQNCDMTAIWQHHADGSPITFERTSSPAMAMTTPTPGPLGSSHGNIRRRIVMDGPQQKSALLQQSLPKTNSGKGRTPKAKQVAGKLPPLQEGFKVSKAPANRHRCEYPECNGKSYSRQEHLKRHYNEAHSDNPETWRCEFCETPKTFGRCDNFRDHLKRHIEKSAGSRTRHEIGAAILLAEMQSKMKNKKKTITRSTTPGTDDEMRSGDSLLSKPARSLVKAETS